MTNGQGETDICGAEKGDGEICTFIPKYSDGRCGHHTETGENEPQGRDSKLTKQREEQIAQAIENGRSMTSAARMAGVSRNAIYSWIEKGEDQDEGIYSDFHDRIRRAQGNGEDFYFSLALQMAKENEDHRFIASLMKQRYPDSWGDTKTGVDAPEINVSSDVVEVTEDDHQH